MTSERAAIITGASQGIGAGLVSAYRSAGYKEPAHGALAALHPMGRMGEIADIVSAVMYLEQANFVTGEITHVDGGQSAGQWSARFRRIVLAERFAIRPKLRVL